MPDLFTLNPHGEKGLRFDLRELLALIAGEGSRLAWRAASNRESMSTVFDDGATFRTLNDGQFGRLVESSPNGLPLTWEEMLSIGTCISQTIWGVYLGFSDPEEPDLATLLDPEWGTLEEATPEFFARVPIAFQAIDSTFWMIHASDPEVRARIESAYGPRTDNRIRWAPYD